jgi:ribonuclease HI
VIRWSKPEKRNYKLNVDASFHPNGWGAVAAVIRNDLGEAVAGGARPMINLLDSTTAEAAALKFGPRIIERLGCSPVMVESDNLEVIDACTGDTDLWSPYSSIMVDCFQIAQRIEVIKFQHCFREANTAAHNLAKLIYDSDRIFAWDGDPPPSVQIDVLNDLMLFDQ